MKIYKFDLSGNIDEGDGEYTSCTCVQHLFVKDSLIIGYVYEADEEFELFSVQADDRLKLIQEDKWLLLIDIKFKDESFLGCFDNMEQCKTTFKIKS